VQGVVQASLWTPTRAAAPPSGPGSATAAAAGSADASPSTHAAGDDVSILYSPFCLSLPPSPLLSLLLNATMIEQTMNKNEQGVVQGVVQAITGGLASYLFPITYVNDFNAYNSALQQARARARVGGDASGACKHNCAPPLAAAHRRSRACDSSLINRTDRPRPAGPPPVRRRGRGGVRSNYRNHYRRRRR